MILVLFVNYYLNSLENESIVTTTQSANNTSNTAYESLITNPEYYTYNNKNQRFFIRANSAKKINNQVNLYQVLGNIMISRDINVSYTAKSGKMYPDSNTLIMYGDIVIASNNNGKLLTDELFVNYQNYSLSSDKKIKLLYDNIILTAEKFSFNQSKSIKFSGSVNLTIKNDK
jgi:LPS export ABC transporter protein LptC